MKPNYSTHIIQISNNDDIGKKIMIITDKMGEEDLTFDDALQNISKEMNFDDNIINNINKLYRLDSILPFNNQKYYHYPYVRDFDPDENIFEVDKVCALINDLIKDNQFDNWNDAANYICNDLDISFDNLINAINKLKTDLNNDNINVQIYIKKDPILKVKLNSITESFDKFNIYYKNTFKYDNLNIINKAKEWIKYKKRNLII